MPDLNPYAPPVAPVLAAPADPALVHLARGQKTVIYGFLVYLLGAFAQTKDPAIGGGLLLGVLCAAAGVFRIGKGLGLSSAVRALTLLAMLVPFVNLATMLVMSGRATRRLRAAGRRVGFLGARG